jgi:hypothetical protein
MSESVTPIQPTPCQAGKYPLIVGLVRDNVKRSEKIARHLYVNQFLRELPPRHGGIRYPARRTPADYSIANRRSSFDSPVTAARAALGGLVPVCS